MTTSQNGEAYSRPLLVNGEALRQSIDRPGGGGGGEKYRPYTVEENAARLISQLADLRPAASAVPAERQGDSLIVEARLHPQFLAASYFPTRLLDSIGATPVGTRVGRTESRASDGTTAADQPTKSLYLAMDPSGLDNLQDLLQHPYGPRSSGKMREDIQTLDRLDLNVAQVTDLLVDQPPIWEAVLHGRVDRLGRIVPASSDAIGRWTRFVEELGGRVETDWIRQTDSLTFAPVRIDPDRLAETQGFNGLRAIHALPVLRDLPDAEPLDDAFVVERVRGLPPSSDTPLRVAVFDGGIDEGQPVWADRVRSLSVGNLAGNLAAQRHGAVVTSALLYGHIGGASLPEPADIDVHHFAAVPQAQPSTDLQMYWLLDAIERQVKADAYDVVVVCVAPRQVVDDDHVDRWTSTLDKLAHEHDVLFVVAAGNNGEQPENLGLNRILVPADAANVLSVGASSDHGPKSLRAAYSAIGPGRPVAQVRPTGVAFGGTDQQPFMATDNDGAKLAFKGTSCAAPLVVHGLADLSARVGRDLLNSVTMRAFAIHFAQPCHRTETLNTVGYGHFRDGYDIVDNCPPNQAHVLYRGTIDRDEFIPLAIPMPHDIPGRVRLRYTLATSTRVAETDPLDYTQAGLEIAFRPHSRKFAFTKGKQRRIVNVQEDDALAAQLMRDGYTPSGEPVTLSLDKRPKVEAALRAEGKWDSVRRLDREFRKEGGLHEPRVELTYLARENGVLLSAADSPTVNWALLVSLEAQPEVALYESVRAEFPVLTTITVPAASATVNAPA